MVIMRNPQWALVITLVYSRVLGHGFSSCKIKSMSQMIKEIVERAGYTRMLPYRSCRQGYIWLVSSIKGLKEIKPTWTWYTPRSVLDRSHLGHLTGLECPKGSTKRKRVSLLANHPTMNRLACLIVIAGFHDFSSSRIDKQTVPDG